MNNQPSKKQQKRQMHQTSEDLKRVIHELDYMRIINGGLQLSKDIDEMIIILHAKLFKKYFGDVLSCSGLLSDEEIKKQEFNIMEKDKKEYYFPLKLSELPQPN